MAKLNVLKSIAHNIGDSIGCGLGFMIGHYAMDVYEEAATSENGYLLVDILNGKILEGEASASLQKAIAQYSNILPDFCRKHGADVSDFQSLHIRFGLDPVYGGHFKVMVTDKAGRSTEDKYTGSPAKRLRTRRPS